MKYLKLFTLLLMNILCSVSVFAQTPTDSLVHAIAIVDGLFFDKSVSTQSLIPGGSSISMLKDPEGQRVMAIYLPQGFSLDEDVVKTAIPSKRVKFSKQLLSQYNGRKPQTTAVFEGIGVNVGEPFVGFEYKDTDNQVWNNEKLKGQIYVINVWQSECGPCRREMPILSDWKNKFPDVVFLSASRHNKEEIIPIVEQHNFNWSHLQEASDIVALVGQQGFPLTVVVDKDGIVRFAKVGASEENQVQAIAVIEELLEE